MTERENQRIAQPAIWGGYARAGEPSAVHDCYFQKASNDADVAQIWGYMDQLSYAVGDVARIHVNTSAEVYDVRIYRDGAKSQEVFARGGVAGAFVHTVEQCSVVGCDWPVGLEILIDPEWASGGYIVELSAVGGLSYQHVFLVRPSVTDKAGRVLLVAATGTWAAYNDWGGSNHYEGITGDTGQEFSPQVSHLRPYARGFVSLPMDAPRIPFKTPPAMGAKIKYPHLEWAYDNGYSKKYPSAGWASFERHYVQWLERAGYAVDVIAQHDLQFHPEVVDGYDCLSVVGHDEYWSWEMRDTIERYVEASGNVARFAGNFFWQTRIGDGGNTQVCYKSTARAADPVVGTDAADRVTICWDAPEIGRAGAQTFGLSGSQGLYAGWGGCAPRGAGGFTVYRPDHWAFAGADVYYGDVLGAASRVFGYEVDGVDHIIRDGLPYATGADGAPENLNILAVGLATVLEADHGQNGALFIGRDDVEFVAYAKFGEVTEDTVDKATRGSGMIAVYERGAGTVFNAGSCEWIAGLMDGDAQVERVTRNVLDRFLAGG